METIITMDQFGRLVLPGRIRKELQVSAPAAFKAEVVGSKVELTPLPAESSGSFKKRRGLLVYSKGGGRFSAAAAMRTIREERL